MSPSVVLVAIVWLATGRGIIWFPSVPVVDGRKLEEVMLTMSISVIEVCPEVAVHTVGRMDLSDRKLPEDQKGGVFVQPRANTTGFESNPPYRAFPW